MAEGIGDKRWRGEKGEENVCGRGVLDHYYKQLRVIHEYDSLHCGARGTFRDDKLLLFNYIL